MRLTLILSAALLAAMPTALHAQQVDNPGNGWTFRLEPLLFESEADEVARRDEVRASVMEATDAASELVDGAALLSAIEAQNRMRLLFRRHDLYLFLKYAVDTRRENMLAPADEMRASVRDAREILAKALAMKSESWLADAFESTPDLERYRYWIASAREQAERTPPEGVERAINEFLPLLAARDYPRIVGTLEFPPVMLAGNLVDFAQNRAQIEGNQDPMVRSAGELSLFQGYASQRELFAHFLRDAIGGANAQSRLRGEDSAFQSALSDAALEEKDHRRLLSVVAENADTFKSWQRRTEDPFSSTAKWTAQDAVDSIVRSASTFDASLGEEFALLLDPAGGRADLNGSGSRLPITGTASVYPIGTSAIFMERFEGTLLDMIVLAHEGGHAVQAQLMAKNQIPMAYATGPGYFTESFGRFQELILLDHLMVETSDEERRTLLRDALAARLLSVFRSAEEAAIELAIHDLVNSGEAVDADALDRLTMDAGSRYVVDYGDLPERAGMWMLSQGYFMAPMQELNDVWASLLAIRYFLAWREDPEAFRVRYLELLSRGYDAAPDELLKSVGIDIHDQNFVGGTMAALRQTVSELYSD